MRAAIISLALLATAAQAEPLSPEALAAVSPLTQHATKVLKQATERLPASVKAQTQEALFPETGCIAYLTGLDPAGEARILDALSAAKFIDDRAAAARSLFGYPHSGKTCPARLQSVSTAPGGDFNGHHAWPGGLAVHEAANLHLAEDFVQQFRASTGDAKAIDLTIVTSAVVWHDWAKTVQFQWQDHRLINFESRIAGTGSHHVIGLAEAMARHLPPRFIIAQACAHALPDDNGGANVTGWLKAAAIIARVDPVKAGLLSEKNGTLTASFGPECHVNFLSDQSWSSEGPALKNARAILAELSGEFGYTKSDAGRYAAYENTALAIYGADAIALSPVEKVKAMLATLHQQGRI